MDMCQSLKKLSELHKSCQWSLEVPAFSSRAVTHMGSKTVKLYSKENIICIYMKYYKIKHKGYRYVYIYIVVCVCGCMCVCVCISRPFSLSLSLSPSLSLSLSLCLSVSLSLSLSLPPSLSLSLSLSLCIYHPQRNHPKVGFLKLRYPRIDGFPLGGNIGCHIFRYNRCIPRYKYK